MTSGSTSHDQGSGFSTGGAMIETSARLVWGELSNEHMLTTALPFRVTVTAVGDDKEPLPDYCGQLTISALTSKVCLSEGFEGRRLGLWCAATHQPRRSCLAHSSHLFAPPWPACCGVAGSPA